MNAVYILFAFGVVVLYWRLQKAPQKHKQQKINQTRSELSHQKRKLITTVTQEEAQEERVFKKRAPKELSQFHLIVIEEENTKAMQDMLKITKSIPRPHPMMHILMKGADNDEELYQLVKSDPVIAAKILQTVNSAEFYLTQKITRLNHAIFYLGTTMIKNIAYQCIIGNSMKSHDKQLRVALENIWANAFLASSLAFIFAKYLGFENAADLTTQTLLSYIGNLAIVTHEPELSSCFIDNVSLFDRVSLEQQKLGIHSALVGSHLATQWDLPEEIVLGIQNSLIPLGVSPKKCTIEGSQLRDLLLCYTSCRAAELFINNNMKSIEELSLFNQDSFELFYLPEYLKKASLSSMFGLLDKPIVISEVAKLIEKIPHTKNHI